MDEPGNKQQSCGNGQQRNQHSRPFFYVQPPSQPYYLYQQWQLNNPYSHYGLPGGFNLGRPCMLPYQYMQYPGFVYPHAPIYPMDYRRMFEPRFQGAPPCGDMSRHNYQQQYHGQGRRETASSEVQTDPSDAITKLMECLDKLRANEPMPEAVRGRELDSGIASQSSGMFSPEEEKKTEEPKPSSSHKSHQEIPVVTYRESRAAAPYDSSQVMSTKDRSWSAGLEEEPPIDSSSVHEDCPELEQLEGDRHFIHFEKEAAPDVQLDATVTELTVPTGDGEESTQPPPFSSGQTVARSSIEVPKDELLEVSLGDDQSDRSYQILKLPLNSVLPPGSAGAASLSSPNAAYYYNYLSMQMTHERMSVLSPSLDELSSRDEMFSTDLDDLDIFPNHVYAGQRLTEVDDGPPRQAQEETGEEWLRGSRRAMCACCGKSLAGGTTRSKAHSTKMYPEDAGDSEDDSRYVTRCDQPVRAVARRQASTRKPHGGTPRHATRPCFKRPQYKEQVEAAEQGRGQDVSTQEAADGKATETGSAELQCRTCQDAPCREELTMSDQSRRMDVNSMSRRRQTAASVQRQETNSQWKVMYHRPRDEDHDDEPPPIHWERDMEAATCSMQPPYGLGPHGHNLPQGPPQEHQPGPSGAPHSDDQQQHSKPFFYVQPPQSYMPMQSLQWPMPLSYNPFFSYPGLGYGMPMMPPHYQPNPYVEPPGFVVPHTHLHLMDYRRLLNPQYYHTMAYHSRRFRYQHNSQSRETTTSEVQTEPLLTPQRTSRQTGSDVDSQGVATACNGEDALSAPSGERLLPATVVPNVDRSPELRDLVSSSTSAAPPNSSFMIQTEEVRIECCTTPVGLQLLHAREAAEMSHGFSQDVVQCSSILQRHVLQDEAPSVPDDHSERVCSDILLVGTHGAGEKIPTMEESRNQVDSVTAVKQEIENDQSTTTDDFNLKVVHLPFDAKYLDELRKMESSVWSIEETLMPSPESLIQNASSGTLNQTLMAAAEAEMVRFDDDGPTEEVTEVNPQGEDGQEDLVSSLEALGDEMVSEADVEPSFEVSKETDVTDQTTGAAAGPHLSLKAAGNHHSREIRSKDHQDTSFESLPAYLPSNRWFSEFDGVFQSGQAPAAPEKRYRLRGNVGLDVPTSRRKRDMEYKDQQGVGVCKPKGQADHGSLSDHEYCLRKSFENTRTFHSPRKDDLCSRCVAKHGICKSAGTGEGAPSLKRKAAPFQQRNSGLLPTCEACKSHPKRRLTRKCCNPEVSEPARGLDPEGESLEKSWCRSNPKWRAMDVPKRPLMSKQNVERRPVPMKLKERNGVHHGEPQHQYTAWERLRHCSHSNAMREMDENSAMPISLQDQWRNQVSVTCRWQADRSWNALTSVTDADNSKNDTRSQHFKHRKAQPPSQGSRRKDARC